MRIRGVMSYINIRGKRWIEVCPQYLDVCTLALAREALIHAEVGQGWNFYDHFLTYPRPLAALSLRECAVSWATLAKN